MVIFAGIQTNVTAVQQHDALDSDYHTTFKKRFRSDELEEVVLYGDSGGRNHALYPKDGYLALRDVQCFGGPDVCQALLNSEEFRLKNGVYTPYVQMSHLGSFKRSLSTLFQLERVSQNPVEISGLISLNADGASEFKETDSYFIQEKEKVDTFITKYNEAKQNSTHGFPVLEGYMTGIKRDRGIEVLNAVFGEDLVRKLSIKK